MTVTGWQREAAIHLEDRIVALAGRTSRLRELAANVVAGAEDGRRDVVGTNLKWIEESAKEAAVEAAEVIVWARRLGSMEQI